MPVSVYYVRPEEPEPSMRRRYHEFRGQPLLLLVDGDQRMWVATPERTTFHERDSGPGSPVAWEYWNNPWIAPLRVMTHDGLLVLDRVAVDQYRPAVDLRAPGQRRVRETLESIREGNESDPRFAGGPVPGELIAPLKGRDQLGLVLHRPANAPARSSPYWSPFDRINGHEYLIFGTDTGTCRGFYLKELTPL